MVTCLNIEKMRYFSNIGVFSMDQPSHGKYFFRICGGLKVGAGIWICHCFRLSSKIGGGQIDIGLDQREERVTIGLDSHTSIATMTKRACN